MPEFGPPRGVFYRQPDGEGKLSTYGDQAYLIATSIAKHGKIDVDAMAEEHLANFGKGSAYDIEAKIGHEPTKADWPVPGPWIHHSIKNFIANKAAGKAHPLGDTSDDQADGPAKIAAVVALEAGKATMLDSVEAVTRLTQNNDKAVAYTKVFAKLLESVILGGTVAEGLAEAQAYAAESGSAHAATAAAGIAASIAAADEDHAGVVAGNGSSCAMPGSLSNAAHALAAAGTDFAGALRPTIAAPGCNCSRACMVGAVLGAALGEAGVPADWIAKTAVGAEAVAAAAAIAEL